MLRGAWTRGLILLLFVAGCGAEPFAIAPPAGMPDTGIPQGSGGTPEPPGSGGAGGELAPPAGTGGADATGGAGVDVAPMGSGGAPVDATPPVDVQPMTDVAPMAPFQCNELIGLNVANQWGPTFELMIGTARWQRKATTNAYIERWADPAHAVWSTPLTSPCATGATNPDRVVLIAFSTTLNTLDGYRTNITQAIATIKMKYPGVKRIELLTTLRSAGNNLCPGRSAFTVVPAYVDAAIQAVADASAGLVTVGPKIEVADCSFWNGANADLAGAGATTVGASYAQYYKDHQ